jgi:ribosomal protein S18 acetylase RimI-like enzyme
MGVVIRELVREDRLAVHGMLDASGAFTEEEIRVALEVFDEGIPGGLDGPYVHFGAEVEGAVCGYVVVGRTPMTETTWHLYWICTHPRVHKTGVGRALQHYAEEFVRERGGRSIVLETSGQPSYARVHEFYRKAGYSEVGRIRDYYKPGDDCILYCKVL